MKKFVLLLICICVYAAVANAQEPKAAAEPPHKDSALYITYPDLPAFNIRLVDSFTVFNTFNIPRGRYSLIILFDPDCKHCKAETKELIAGMDSLSDIDMYFITPVQSVTEIKKFYDDNHFANYKNIKVIGRDYEFFFHDFFQVHFVPDLALYDDHKKFVHLFEGRATVKDLYDYVHKK